MKNKSNFKYFLDWLSENWIFPLIIIFLIFGIFGVGPCSSQALAKCMTHTVVKGDTLGELSKQFYGDKNYWKDIKRQNDLKTSRLTVGQQLSIYIPDEGDWSTACYKIATLRAEQKLGTINRAREKVLRGIPQGIHSAFRNYLPNLTPLERLELCRYAIVTAEQESMYEFAVGSAGEIGPYQFKLGTIRLTRASYDLLDPYTDKQIVTLLLAEHYAAMMFVLHFNWLHKHSKSLWLAWKRYNNGSEASEYASKAIRRYQEVRRIQPRVCKP